MIQILGPEKTFFFSPTNCIRVILKLVVTERNARVSHSSFRFCYQACTDVLTDIFYVNDNKGYLL